jgi:hypothetical protein
MRVLFFSILVGLPIIVVVAIRRGDERRDVFLLSATSAATLLMLLPDVVSGSRAFARVASVALLVGVSAFIFWRRRG